MGESKDSLAKNAANYVPLTPLSFLARAASLYPERPAVIYGQIQWSWREFHHQIMTIAAGLRARGIAQGDVVSVLCPNIPELYVLQFAIPLAGGVLNTLNTRLEAETVGYTLDHAEAKLVIVEREYVPLLQQAFALMTHSPAVLVIDDVVCPQQDPVMWGESYASLQQGKPMTHWVIEDEWQSISLNYTSGTSGRPKGVVYHHRGAYLMALGTVAAWQMRPFPVYLSVVPMFHCNGWGHPWVMAILAGTMVFTRMPLPERIFAAIDAHGVDHFGAAPVVLQMLCESALAPQQAYDPPIRVMTAGAPPPPSVLEQARRIGFDVMQVYGLTETYGHIAHCLWQEDWQHLSADQQAKKQAQQGVSLPMVEQVTVLDKAGNPVARDSKTQGEIAIRGNTLMKGYYKDAQATDEAFAGGWFRSGDVAVVHADGYMQVNDRLKDMIISGGENISSIEVETVLYRHPAVQSAAVVAKPDEKWGEVPCAFVELRPEAAVKEAEIIAFCRQHLAGFKTPKSVIFGDLPKTATGKIQKFSLRERVKARQPS